MTLRSLPRLAVLVVIVLGLSQCTSVKKADVVVSVKDQKLGLYEQGELKKTFKISTSKFGLGDKPGSNCTPLGKHQVVAKIGHGLPAGAVLKSRRWSGEVLKPNAPGRDPIVSRILWLKGTESSNRHAFNRFIYIHGTPEEKNLGHPASYGCVRMGMKDVVSVFNSVGVGANVVITPGELPRGEKPVEAKADDGSPATVAAADDKAAPIEIAKVVGNEKEKANAEKNLKDKAGPEKPASSKPSSTSKSRTASKKTSSTPTVTKKQPAGPARSNSEA
ncbi:MAG: L,D-transpeptidase family protein [Verrucomicrobiaceae bacterium]|nr:L,D-transpeptidase family protein [Verrucomicrobiaceae bacterium]